MRQKRPFKLKEIWAIRTRLQLSRRTRDLALFNLGIDSKLRACDLVKLRVRDVANGDRTAARANVVRQKTGRPVQFELTEESAADRTLTSPLTPASTRMNGRAASAIRRCRPPWGDAPACPLR